MVCAMLGLNGNRRALVLALAGASLFAFAGCCPTRTAHFPLPFPSAPAASLRTVAAGFDVVYPASVLVKGPAPLPAAPPAPRRAGIVAPRLGIPALLGPGAGFELELLERAQMPAGVLRAALVAPSLPTEQLAACLSGLASAQCVPLRPTDEQDEAVADGFMHRTISVALPGSIAAAAWDLAMRVDEDPPERQPRCVFTYATPTDAPRPLRVVHLSDIHIGKFPLTEGGLVNEMQRVVAEINHATPDLVVLTGDLVENGGDEPWTDRARELLLTVHAPLLIVPGNHDYSHYPKVVHSEIPAAGWLHFARRFHSRRRTRLTFGGWDFLGIDSGPSIFSLQVMTRGVGGDTLQWLHRQLELAHASGHGAIVYAHAPTRTGPLRNSRSEAQGQFGRMWYGAAQMEEALQAAADRGTRVLSLSGHTHWLEVQLLRPASPDPNGRWQRQPDDKLACQPLVVTAPAAMLTVPAATRVTFPMFKKGDHAGFAILELPSPLQPPTLHFRLFNSRGVPLRCKPAP